MKTKNLFTVENLISELVETSPNFNCQIKDVTGYLSRNKHKRKQNG